MGPYSQQAKLATYRSVSAHGAVADADPHALVLTVMDATLARINAARTCIERKETGRMASLLHSSVILIAELRGSLNLQKGGPLAQNLSDLYEYMTRRLMLANLNSDPAPVVEVLSLLGEIRSAWVAIGPQVRQAPGPVTSAA
ncbi:MAG TPA: flagellar export chaperone FliS [Steroidobacteraceae bacterium]|nr:flagellar export chaperone FliS [Steroidobacteraceae bacterium]